MRTRTRKRGQEADLVEQIEDYADSEPEPREVVMTDDELIPSGSTMLNCACSDNPYGAYGLGKITTLPGGSASGKTILKFTMFAEMNRQKRFDDYAFIYDDTEEALEFDIAYLFGKKTEKRIIPPRLDGEGYPRYSRTIQEFKDNILTWCKKGDHFVYVLDSLDALSSDEEMEKEYKKALLSTKDPSLIKELSGSYHTEKAKIIGHILRICNNAIKETGSALIIVQQERDKVGVTFGSKKTTSGGRAPFYYSTHQVWLSKTGNIKDGDLKTGTHVKAEVKKNKLTGKMREVEFDIYNDYGIDDISSCVEFLCKNHWKKIGKSWDAKELNIEGNKRKIVGEVENRGLEDQMKEVVGEAWRNREESVRLRRKPKYR